MKTKKGDWVIVGGKPGEVAYCTRCGEGLSLNMPQRIEVFVAASKAFVTCHMRCQPGTYHDKPAQTPEEWAAGRDSGTSSLTIYAAITGNPMGRDFDIPYDPADFGRCYRLLKLFPAWRSQLHKVVTICPRWTPYVEAWDELTDMFERSGWADRTKEAVLDDGKMYARMRELEAIADETYSGELQGGE